MVRRLSAALAVLVLACGDGSGGPDKAAPVLTASLSAGRLGPGGALTVTVTANEALESFSARVAGAPAICSALGNGFRCTYAVTGQEPEGPQSVAVSATDLAGNAGAASASVSFDFSGPELSLLSGPPPLSSETVATFAFEAADQGTASFTCALDDGAAAGCVSPFTSGVLAEGAHVFSLTATDDLGNSASLTVDFVIALHLPETTLVEGVPALTRDTSHTVKFTSDDPAAGFQCRLDSAAFTTCSSPFLLSGFAEGAHVLEIRAITSLGLYDPSPIRIEFVADRTPPVTTFGPAPSSGASTVALSFTVNEEGSTTECRLNGGALAPCVSPVTLTSLLDGQKLFEARSTDPAGNVAQTFASVSFTVDTTPPQTTITTRPAAAVRERVATFEFGSSEANSTFLCTLDGVDLPGCTSPLSFSNLADGTHTFTVAATDRFGNEDLSPATWTWSVDVTPPVAGFTAPVPALVNRAQFTVEFSANEAATFQCSVDGAPFFACVSPRKLINLTDTVSGGEPPHVLTVRPTDGAGNVGADLTASFHVDLSAPAPGPVRLISPDPARTSNRTPTFAWEGTHATTYDFELSTDPTFADAGQRVALREDVPETEFTPSSPLPSGRYYVRLRGRNSVGPGEYSMGGLVEINGGWVKHTKKQPLNGVACKNANECILVGDAGLLLRTTDGGLTFTEPPIPSPAASVSPSLFGVAWVDESTVVVSGVGRLLRSTNGGISWAEISRDANGGSMVGPGAMRALGFRDGRGLAMGFSGDFFVSSDGGQSWLPGTIPLATPVISAEILSVDDSDPQNPSFTAMALDDAKRFYRTTDGARSWTSPMSLPPGTSNCTSLSFFDAQRGFVACSGAGIYRTANAGLTWTGPSPTAPSPSGRVGAVLARTAERAVFTHDVETTATPAASVRAVTFGAGTTWANAIRTDGGPARGATLNALTAAGSDKAFAVGSDVFVVRDTGSAFEFERAAGVLGFLPEGGAELRSMDFPTASTGFIVGTNGLALKTTDGGATFTALNVDQTTSSEELFKVKFLDANVGFVVGRNPVSGGPYIARTTDGGATWTPTFLNSTSWGAEFDIKDATTGWAVDGTSKVWHLDASGNWVAGTTLPTAGWPGSLSAVAVVSNDEVYVGGGNGGNIARWNGSAWGLQTPSGVAFAANWTTAEALPSGVVIFVNDRGQIFRRDGSWQKVFEDPAARTFNYVHFRDADTGWAVGNNGLIVATLDGGLTWAPDPTLNSTERLWTVFGRAGEVLVGGNGVGLWRKPL